jgi:hypothetical protein
MWLSVFGRQPIKLHVLEAPNPRIVDCPWTRGWSSNPTGGTLSHASALALGCRARQSRAHRFLERQDR